METLLIYIYVCVFSSRRSRCQSYKYMRTQYMYICVCIAPISDSYEKHPRWANNEAFSTSSTSMWRSSCKRDVWSPRPFLDSAVLGHERAVHHRDWNPPADQGYPRPRCREGCPVWDVDPRGRLPSSLLMARWRGGIYKKGWTLRSVMPKQQISVHSPFDPGCNPAAINLSIYICICMSKIYLRKRG